MEPCTVLFPFTGESVGGSHISALLLTKHLDPSRYLPHVLVASKGRLTEFLSEHGIEHDVLDEPRLVTSTGRIGGLRALLSVPRLTAYLRDKSVAIVHTHDSRMHRAWGLASGIIGKPHVWHQRTLGIASRRDRLIARQAAVIISVSSAVTQSLPGGMPKTIEVPNPVVAPRLNMQRAEAHKRLCLEFGFPRHAGIVGFFGNLRPDKQPLRFVRLAAAVAQQDSSARFLMFGADSHGLSEAILRLAEEQQIEDRIHVAGFRSNIYPVMAGCNVIVAPSTRDAFGRVVAEAMAVGTPVVAANAGGYPKLIEDGETGILVDDFDIEEGTQAVVQLLADSGVGRSMGERAAKYVRDRFSPNHHADVLMDVYDDVLAGANQAIRPPSR